MIPDTSAEAVERRIRELQEAGFDNGAAMLRALRGERDELRASFDLRWKADMRAIRLRREQSQDDDNLTWPDHADLVVWLLAERDRLAAEVASLRLTLGGKTFSNDVPEPIGCPAPGACATVAEIVRLREALTKLADAAQFAPLDLSRALTNARAALAGEGR